jgi:hypothetical protein
MRKFGVGFCALVLFVSLLVLAFSTSANIAFKNSHKIETWLDESNLYGAFVQNAINQAEQTAGTDQSGGISLSDTVVEQAAQSSFSSQALQDDVDAFLDSNYAWLQGKTNVPNFKIDLTSAKRSFAERVGNYVTTYLNGLPACTPQQLAALDPQTTDPLTLQCRPSGIDPATEGQQVTSQIEHSSAFLGNPVLTAANINPHGGVQNQGQPYYARFSSLPQAYRANTYLPWIAGVLALLSGAGAILFASRKRKGLKVVGVVLLLDGVVMLLAKLGSDETFHQVENRIFNAATVGQLQKALTTFFHHAEMQIAKTDMWFGVAYLALALVVLIILLSTTQRRIRPAVARLGNLPGRSSEPAERKQPKAELTDRLRAGRPAGPSPTETDKDRPAPKRPKPPRLIQ